MRWQKTRASSFRLAPKGKHNRHEPFHQEAHCVRDLEPLTRGTVRGTYMPSEESRRPRRSGPSSVNPIPKIVKTTHEVAIDHTSKYDYDKLTKEEIAEYNQVEVT